MDIIVKVTPNYILVAARMPYGIIGRCFSHKHISRAESYLARLESFKSRNQLKAA